jgi:hypothetical protein
VLHEQHVEGLRNQLLLLSASLVREVDDPRHVAILECLDQADRQLLLEHKAQWSADHRRKVRGTIIDWANQLDSMVLAFNYNVANKFILCKNLSSFTMQREPSQIKLLFDKINKMQIWPGAPNLWEFMRQFERPSTCEEFPGKPSEPVLQTVIGAILQK